MAAHNEPVSEFAIELGKGFKFWREANGLSQQDIHHYGQCRKVNIFNSQCAYLERGLLDAKSAFYIGLRQLMKDIQEEGPNGFKFITKEVTRKRFQQAKPFLTHDGNVATAGDIFTMFVGEQPIREEYLKVGELADEICSKYGHSLERTFNKIAHERLLSPKKTWDELAKTKDWPQNKTYQAVCKDILRGEHDLTADEVVWCLDLGEGECPCYRGLSLLANKSDEEPVDISMLTRENKKLLALAR